MSEQETAEQPYDLVALGIHYGGDWCDCIDKVIKGLTAKKLAAYCIKKSYKEFPAPTEDDLGVRYGYLLVTRKERVQVAEDEQQVRDVNHVASFGDFHHRGLETIQSVISAIKKISQFEGRSAQAIAVEVIACKEEDAPKPRQAKSPIAEPAFQPKTGRYRQDSMGNVRPI